VWLGCLRGDAGADALGAVGCDLEYLETVLDTGIGGAASAPHQDMPRRNLSKGKKINIAVMAVLWIRIRSDPIQDTEKNISDPGSFESEMNVK
jgi:hypothetical protein